MTILSDKELKNLRMQHYEAGFVIFRERERPGPVYLIQEGEVELYRERKGKRVTICRIGPNSVFGEMSMIDNKPRSTSAVALTEVKCLAMDADAFHERIEQLEPFMRGIMRVLVDCLRNSTDAITSRIEGARS